MWENVTRWACLVCEKSVEIREICGRQLSAQCAKEQAGCFYSPTDLSDKHRYHAGCLYQKNTDCTNAHGWVFSRILYSCSAAYRLVLMRRRRNGLPRIFSQAEGALRSEKSVEIREICGRQIGAQCAKEQAGCFYSPTDLSDKHRCHAGCLYQKHGLHRCARMGLFTDSLVTFKN